MPSPMAGRPAGKPIFDSLGRDGDAGHARGEVADVRGERLPPPQFEGRPLAGGGAA